MKFYIALAAALPATLFALWIYAVGSLQAQTRGPVSTPLIGHNSAMWGGNQQKNPCPEATPSPTPSPKKKPADYGPVR